MSIYKDCDIRGIFPDELTAADTCAIGRALASLMPKHSVIRVGGDVRVSTPELKCALIRGMLESGSHVQDLGMIPTPLLYFALSDDHAAAGATVTASHNPPEYNGVKFMLGREPVTRDLIDLIRDTVEAKKFREDSGVLEQIDLVPDYLASLRSRFSAKKPLHVVIDAGNGAMSNLAPAAFRSAGYQITELFCEPDGRFPNRSPNPAEYECLGALCAKVAEVRADFGVAFDGDGDRAVFVDNRGCPVQNEKTLVMFIRHLLQDKPTPVVYDQKASSVVRSAVQKMGGAPIPERSGHAFIKRKFLEVGAAVAGEVSGHFFFDELGYDDGLFAALMMAEMLGESGKTLAECANEIVCPPITKDVRVACPYAQQGARLAEIERIGRESGGEIMKLDGVRVEWPDGWVLVRRSVTAEQITMRAEAQTADRLREICQRFGIPADA